MLRYMSSMSRGRPKELTPKQMKFAELFVTHEGRMTATQAAEAAGYTTRPRQTASELRNPNLYPLVVKYIGELRQELQRKYEVTFENHIAELAKLRDEARAKGAWSAAGNMEIARGKAAGLYVEQKIIKHGRLEDMTEKELELKMKQIIDDHKGLLIEGDFEEIKNDAKESNGRDRQSGEDIQQSEQHSGSEDSSEAEVVSTTEKIH
jgi:phage terminase small subunit